MVYSAAKQNPSLSLEWAKSSDIGLPRPDILVYLDLDPEEAEKRGGYGDEKYEKKEMQRVVRSLFNDLKNNLAGEDSFYPINAGASVPEVAELIEPVVMDTVLKVQTGQIGALGLMWQ
jgi:dTMP kinase